ncbi:MAG: sugar phosphate isomerase/epimerase [Sedimentisphaerales bacterium]|nr:sugar phosphate isomerase/epimerase [Sedimentisphaerales bacterium]
MLIGLKLDIGFSQDEVYRQLYGGREILPLLKELGVEVVETPMGPELETSDLQEHIARCVDAGLKVSFHPYSEGTLFNPVFFSPEEENPCRTLHERFFLLAAEAARRQRFPTVVNIHAAAGIRADPRQYLLKQSIAFFMWAHDWCRDNVPQVRVAVELQISPDADEPRQRIGDTYDELLEISIASDAAACWDFGHAYWNARRYGWPLHPPQALIPRIAHVHCHDVCGDDHQPLIYDTVPWRDFLKLLILNHFDDRVILEVPPSEFLRAGGLHTLTKSLELLRAWIHKCKAEALLR